MKTLLQSFVQSAAELKKIRSIAGIAMLVALDVVLSFLTIPIGPTLKVSLGFLATALLGMLYGPVAAALGASLGDILSYLLTPGNSMGAYFFGFTLTAFLGGLVFGIAFYPQKFSLPRVIISKVLITVFLNVLLNTYWISILYGKTFGLVELVSRVVKNIIFLPLEIAALYFVLRVVVKLMQRHKIATC